MMMRVSQGIQTPIIGNLRTEIFPITRSRVSFPQQLRCCEAESGREHSTLTIRDTPTPHCESLIKKYGDVLVDAVESFPNLPGKETPRRGSQTSSSRKSKKLTMAQLSEIESGGKVPPNILYFFELGLDIDQIKSMTCRNPGFLYYSLEGKIKPMVKFLLEVGVNPSDIPSILSRRPHLCGISLSEKLLPTMTYLESLGVVDKKEWAEVFYRCPALLTYSRQKLKATVDFLYELGLTSKSVGKVLTRYPVIVCYSVEENLRPTAEYMRSLGVDVAVLVYHCPRVLSNSIEGKIKPMIEFFLEKGYTIEEVGAIFSRFGSLLCFSLVGNIIPKWEFFLTMDYPMSALVKFPQYFGYSLEKRIKRRYAIVRESGVRFCLSQLLSFAEPKFEQILKRRVEKNSC